ncbi:hypothetical protein TNCV_2307111 [Trichonephila clavipes]|nr:hypothetical protein TNCV_2307111 [Trichonephila clavipes]
MSLMSRYIQSSLDRYDLIRQMERVWQAIFQEDSNQIVEPIPSRIAVYINIRGGPMHYLVVSALTAEFPEYNIQFV